tara:strand:+ start:285 stop:410 length:126 start_codon:yes stop_codon:yes gene_type:complete
MSIANEILERSRRQNVKMHTRPVCSLYGNLTNVLPGDMIDV